MGCGPPTAYCASMRQSSHMRIRSIWPCVVYMEWPLSRSTTASIVFLVPKGLPQEMHSNGSSSLSTISEKAARVKSKRGSSEITFSGQVSRHRPHWTHAASWKRSCGRSGLSRIAAVGQALTQARHSVQPAMSTLMRP